MARNDPQVNLRMPADLKERLDEAASETGRSLTAEITSRLAWTFQAHEHAYLIRALLDLHEKLLAGKDELDIPHHLQDEIRERAEPRGIAPQKFLISLILEALNALDEKTDLGKELEGRILELERSAGDAESPQDISFELPPGEKPNSGRPRIIKKPARRRIRLDDDK